ncbi:uncharacterized protein LOC106011564 [Aplysia californica]|uniref:Uncharacterized protein LOC106011564 n=1 Tax=Aplysia californica TaxID=6500 RepID=A0ABM0ZYG0_APLCA|nr:uncharacterized protein LOC106011564 [Aplysia californica]
MAKLNPSLIPAALFVFLHIIADCPEGVQCQDSFTHDLKIRYFSDVSLLCDHPGLNITDNPSTVNSISWVLPDGTTIDANSLLNDRKYVLSGPDDDVSLPTRDRPAFDAFNLTVLRVDDDVFGYYTCVIVRSVTPGSGDAPISVVRWGLNVDGADFSELLETYKENAIIGGAAAAGMLVLVGGGCLFYHCRYSSRKSDGDASDDDDDKEGVTNGVALSYNNDGFKSSDVEVINVEVTEKL